MFPNYLINLVFDSPACFSNDSFTPYMELCNVEMDVVTSFIMSSFRSVVSSLIILLKSIIFGAYVWDVVVAISVI